MDLSAQFREYLITQRNPASKSTVKNYLSDVNRFISWYESKIQAEFNPELISIDTIEQFKSEGLQGYSPSSVERTDSSLRKFFAFLKIDGKISRSPFESVESRSRENYTDPWRIKDFKNYLYVLNASNLTIKNYIIDVKQFRAWTEQTIANDSWDKSWDINEANIVENIDSELINEYKYRLLNDLRLSPVSVNRKLSSLRKYILWLNEVKIIKTNMGVLNNLRPIPVSTSSAIIPSQDVPVLPVTKSYSNFPPLRLLQKSKAGIGGVLDVLVVSQIANLMNKSEETVWRMKGKPVFENENPGKNEPIKNIPKSFYAPNKISLKNMPVHKRAIHKIKYSRPGWYRKYHSYRVSSYIHLSILMVTISLFAYLIFNNLNPDKKTSVLAGLAPPSIPRVLSFQGKLTDSNNTPINKPTTLRLALYNSPTASGSALLWQEVRSASPDNNGVFSLNLGKNTPIPDSIQVDNSTLWLGITVESTKELTPRQILAAVPLAGDSQTLQGLGLITGSSNATNVILALNSSGNLTIGGTASPTFQATGGTFTISGRILILSTTPESNGNVVINPDGTGIIDLHKVIQNTSNNGFLVQGAVQVDDIFVINADSPNQAAFYITQDSTGDLIIASVSGAAKFRVDNSGAITKGVWAGTKINSAFGGTGLDSTSLTGVPYVSQGVWTVDSNSLGVKHGGTGMSSYSPGDLLYASGNEAISRLTIGTNGTCLVSNGSAPDWGPCVGSTLGIGTSTPNFTLDVQNSSVSSAAAQIYNTSNGTDADGLIIKLGNAGSSVFPGNHFISFETAGVGVVGSIQGNGGKNIAYVTSGVADFAEHMRRNPNKDIAWGSILCPDKNGEVEPCNDEIQSGIIGVASEFPTFLGGRDFGVESITVGLTGVVETLVSNLNGDITPGDFITVSNLPGVGVKSTEPGQVVGVALSDYSASETGKIQVRVAPSWHDPKIYLTNKGNVSLTNTAYEELGIDPGSLSTKTNQTNEKIGLYTDVVLTKLKGGYFELGRLTVEVASIISLKVGNLSADSLALATENFSIAGENIRDYINSIVDERTQEKRFAISSPILETDQIKPKSGKNLSVELPSPDSKFIIQNSTSSAVASIDSSGNATFSGNLRANSGQFSDASVGGTLRAGKIIADQLDLSEEALKRIAGLSLDDQTSNNANLPDIIAATGTFSNGLSSFGPSSFFEISVADRLFVGSQLSIAENSINVLGQNLQIQSLRQGGISFVGNQIVIDVDGNLTVNGNAYFAKDLEARGTLMAGIIAPIPGEDLIFDLRGNQAQKNQTGNPSFIIRNSTSSALLSINSIGDLWSSGSGTFKKLNLSFIPEAIAVSDTEIISTGSAGSAEIKPYKNELTIRNPLVTKNSLIYITPKTGLPNQSIYLLRQVPGESFTVGLSKAIAKEVPFNWILIN